MATCPKCKASSRTDPNFEVVDALVAQPIGSSSLAGVMTKVSAVSALKMQHTTCGWSVLGRIEDEYFVVDPELSEWAAKADEVSAS